ncbi:CHAT domain-containing protein [Kitasatospora sp. NPDC050543]|uniref:CHAT domain-containing protein n=1 Tax=Kitasatospora sp. NPDC050543 TaxID=3364054 RepID=UPI0037BD1EA0
MTFEGSLPLPWQDGNADIDVPALFGLLDSAPDAARSARDLALALRYASARTRGFAPPESGTAPLHVRHAQVVLETAVEWRMPEVERWAVAWLTASRLPHLRMRWSSRSRDGRVRLDGRASGGVQTMAGCREGICLGTDTGEVEAWTPDGGTTRAGAMREAVWTVAANQDWLFAAGAHAHSWCRGPGGGSPWPELPHAAGVSAAAVSAEGLVVCGDERGVIRVCEPGGRWAGLPVRRPSKVVAVAVAAGWIRVAWKDGWTAVLVRGGGGWHVHIEHGLGGTVGCAAWAADGRLAFALDGDASVRVLDAGAVRTAWLHHGVRQMVWSPDGRLATAGADQHVRVASPVSGTEPDELGAESRITALAFASDRFLVTAHGRDLVQWDMARSGSDDPTFQAADEITALGLAPDDRGLSAAGTLLGLLWQYDARGVASQWTPAHTPGAVHQLVRHRGGWLVASQGGAYWWRPPEIPRQLSNRLCLAVAVWRGRAVFGRNTQLVRQDDDGQTTVWEFDAPVRDIAVCADRSLAALDHNGTVVVLGPDGQPWVHEEAGDRLLAHLPEKKLLMLAAADPVATVLSPRGSQRYAWLRPGAASVVANDRGELVAAYPDKGVVVFGQADAGTRGEPVVVSEVPGQFSVVAAASERIIAAGRGRVAGYDRSDPREVPEAPGTVMLRVAAEGSDFCRISFPGGAGALLPAAKLARLQRDAGGDGVKALSDAVHLGGQLGDQLWFAGLDREIDRARGEAPERPVRLDWLIEEGPLVDHPWELLHPSTAPLTWFASPPVTMVRVVTASCGRTARASSGQHTGRPRMLVVRTDDPLLGRVDDAYDQMRRRTRRSSVRLVSSMPQVVRTTADLDRTLVEADIVHLWAHSGRGGVVLPLEARPVPVADMAHCIAATGPRLVILVGCSSAALGREIVRRGVEAVVGMRTAVYSHTVQPLVEELTAHVLAGVPVDLAFAEALRHYVLTGQPGAPAVPLLHLLAGSNGSLFPPTDHT